MKDEQVYIAEAIAIRRRVAIGRQRFLGRTGVESERIFL